MRAPRILIVTVLVLILVIGTLGCSLSPTGIIPQSGYWASVDYGTAETGIEFYVSSDGKRITASGSPIDDDFDSLSINCYTDFGSSSYGTGSSCSIIRSKFTHNGLIFVTGKISGTFSDKTHCSGTVNLDVFGFPMSFDWTATPQTYSPTSFSKSSNRFLDLP